MSADDFCPMTKRECHHKLCESGGCRKMRKGSVVVNIPKPAAIEVRAEAVTENVDHTEVAPVAPRNYKATKKDDGPILAQLRKDVADAEVATQSATSALSAMKKDISALFDGVIAGLEQSDAALTYMVQAMGVKNSPRLDELRDIKAKVRKFYKAHRIPSKLTEEEAVEA